MDIKMVSAMKKKSKTLGGGQFDDAEELSDAEGVDAPMVVDSDRRSSEKLDCLAEVAVSFLNDDDQDTKPAAVASEAAYPMSAEKEASLLALMESSKPLKKRKHRAQPAAVASEPMIALNNAWMERITLKPRVGDFEQHCEEHLFAYL